jgi:uncharacterized protein YwgA
LSFESWTIGRSALVLLALQSAGGIKGRTKVQKILYLANLCGWNCIRDYRYYRYGPYSDAVAAELDLFKKNACVLENAFPTSDDKVAHSYSLTEKGRKVAMSLASKVDNEKLIKKTMSMVKELDQFSSDDLEVMATLAFLRRNEPGLVGDDLIKRFLDLKPRFREMDAKTNMRVFNILRNYGCKDKLLQRDPD